VGCDADTERNACDQEGGEHAAETGSEAVSPHVPRVLFLLQTCHIRPNRHHKKHLHANINAAYRHNVTVRTAICPENV